MIIHPSKIFTEEALASVEQVIGSQGSTHQSARSYQRERLAGGCILITLPRSHLPPAA